MIKMTPEQVRENPQMFMYAWATPSFMRSLGKYKSIVAEKWANQRIVLGQIATDNNLDFTTFVKSVEQSFVDIWGVKPLKALQILAEGGSIAGKDWSKGMYGVGTTYPGWSNTDVTVDEATGKILKGGVEVDGQSVYYGTGKNKIAGYTVTIDGKTYSSQYKRKKYYAGILTDADNNKFLPDGSKARTADFSNIWEGVESLYDNFIEWLIKLFDKLLNTDSAVNQIKPENTFPSQVDDGMATKRSNLTEVLSANSGIILLALGAGTLLATGGLPGMKKKKGKKSRK